MKNTEMASFDTTGQVPMAESERIFLKYPVISEFSVIFRVKCLLSAVGGVTVVTEMLKVGIL